MVLTAMALVVQAVAADFDTAIAMLNERHAARTKVV